MSTPQEILDALLRDRAPILMESDSDFTELLQGLIVEQEDMEAFFEKCQKSFLEVVQTQQETIQHLKEQLKKLS